MQNAPPLLVTGSHRSGSTWLGKMLALSRDIGYISEPFIPGRRPGICGARFEHWFTYITNENEGPYIDPLQETLHFSFDASAEFRVARTPFDVLRTLRDAGKSWYYRTSQCRPLIKDPIAFFSSPWLAQRYHMQVVIVVRHPAAFVGSLKRMNWTFDFNNLLQQPLLMQDLLPDYEEEVRTFALKSPDIIDQASLLWKIIYHTAHRFQDAHPSWIVVRHEDLSTEPVSGFRQLYNTLDIPWTQDIHDQIEKYSSDHNPQEAPKQQIHQLKRNSKANIWNWKKRLHTEETRRIRHSVEEISSLFYSDKDW